MNASNSTPSSATVSKSNNVAPVEKAVCSTLDAYYDMVQENGEMDELRHRIECASSFRDSFNDME
jgi:phosphoenolpyruvate synthase/pyruvate phosphate dikinase